ncbi:CHAD domain-containing protein [Phenylobacterium sp.]|jgi:inorganic triphosphatase YgiF|uniref:CYTH and CHAD domain-containing protein n=1 Tax=Phenylobacterium sp. TaxID=1871053 RepID=UPI002F3F6A03
MAPPRPTAGLETELKFEVDSASIEKLKTHPALAGPASPKRLRSVYFDTPHHDLKNHGVTLRVREADDGFVQTVKKRQGAGLFARDEWESAVAGVRPDTAALQDTPAGDVLNGHAGSLAPVFATIVERQVHLWRHDGDVVEVSLDQGEITAGSQSEPIRELELELKAGDPAALFALARDLAQGAPIRLSFDSKGERGYRLAGHDGLAALKAERTAVSGDMSAAEAFRRVARSALGQIAGNAQLLRRARLPDALHQTRVGLRRFRAALAVFGGVLRGPALDEVRAQTKWLAEALDEARDIDVFMQSTFRPAEAAAGEGDPTMAALGARLRHAQAEAYERAVAAIESPRFAALLLDVAAWVEVGAWTHAEAARRCEPVRDLGARELDRLSEKVLKKGRHLAKLEPAERHQLRIKAKKLRYATEFFGGAFGPKAERRRARYLASLRTLQDTLGELNDIAVARAQGPGFLNGRGADVAFAAGLIVGRRERREPDLLDASEKAFAAFRQARPFWEP